jgi:hypothetical protein
VYNSLKRVCILEDAHVLRLRRKRVVYFAKHRVLGNELYAPFRLDSVITCIRRITEHTKAKHCIITITLTSTASDTDFLGTSRNVGPMILHYVDIERNCSWRQRFSVHEAVDV